MNTRAWIWNGSTVPELVTQEVPALGERDVLVRIRAIGICATDLHLMSGAIAFADPPLALGHEAAGEVVQIGSRVSRTAVGDRCALDPSIGCGHCNACIVGEKHQCVRNREYGINIAGFWQEYVVIHENNLHLIPQHIGYDEATQCETMHVCLGGIDKLHLKLGDKAIILGDGPTGLFFARLCKLQGVSHLTVAGTEQCRLELAEAYGADETVNVRREILLEKVRERSYDVVIEAAGRTETIQMSQKLVANQGRILLFGLPDRQVSFDVMDLITREISCLGTANAPKVWPRVITLLAKGDVRVAPMITHRFPYSQLDEAIAFAFDNRQDRIKIVVTNGKDA